MPGPEPGIHAFAPRRLGLAGRSGAVVKQRSPRLHHSTRKKHSFIYRDRPHASCGGKADIPTLPIAVALSFVAPILVGCVTQPPTRDDMKAILRAQIQRCYVVPAAAKDDAAVTLEFRLKADGTLAHTPAVAIGDANSAIAKAAMRSLERCAPFAIPASAAAGWPNGFLLRIDFLGR
jgi:hypothetical protein